MDINSQIVPNNNHFLIRNRNVRNQLLKDTDYFMLNDVYEILTLEQQKEIKEYRQLLREFINTNKNKYLDDGIPYIEFPTPPEWTKIKNIKF